MARALLIMGTTIIYRLMGSFALALCGNGIIEGPTETFGTIFLEDFESIGNGTISSNGTIYSNGDYSLLYTNTTSSGRASYGTESHDKNGGNSAITLDVSRNLTMNTNYLIIQKDMGAYNNSSVVLSFDYAHHREEKHFEDRVWIRGSLSDSRIEVYDRRSNRGRPNDFITSNKIYIGKILIDNNQSFSSTFQIRFGQKDNYRAGLDGLTIDNIKISGNIPSPTTAEQCDDGNTIDGDGCSSTCMIEPGELTIWSNSPIDLGGTVTTNTKQELIETFVGAFSIKDTYGNDAGRYTTIGASDLLNTAGDKIPNHHISLYHPGTIQVTSGSPNPRIQLNNQIVSGYTSLGQPITYLKRDPGPNDGIKGSYTTNPSIKVKIPAYQSAGLYSGTLVFTLYEG